MMSTKSLDVKLFLFFLFAATFTNVQSQRTTACNNTVIIAGEQGKLEFFISGNQSESVILEWTLLRPRNPADAVANLAVSGSKPNIATNFSHFSVAKGDDNSSWTFFINSTKLEDAGNYTLDVKSQRGEKLSKFSCQVIVLESLPRCQLNHLNTSTELSCEVGFRGFWPPSIDWIVQNNDGTFKQDAVTNITLNSLVSSSLTVSGNFSFENNIYVTMIYFNRSDNDQLVMNATNTPDFVYRFQWNLSEIGRNSQMLDRTDSSETLILILGVVGGICLAIAVINGVVCYRRKRTSVKRGCGIVARPALPPIPPSNDTVIYETLEEPSTPNTCHGPSPTSNSSPPVFYYTLEGPSMTCENKLQPGPSKCVAGPNQQQEEFYRYERVEDELPPVDNCNCTDIGAEIPQSPEVDEIEEFSDHGYLMRNLPVISPYVHNDSVPSSPLSPVPPAIPQSPESHSTTSSQAVSPLSLPGAFQNL